MSSLTEMDMRSSISCKSLRHLLDHWLAARAGRLMPARGDIDPTAIVPAIGQVWIMEVTPDTDSFRYRLAGEDINMVYGFSLAGKTLEEVHGGENLIGIRERLSQVVNERCILYSHGVTQYRDGETSRHDRLVLPLSDDGQAVSDVIGVTKYAFPRNSKPGDLLHHVIDEITVIPLTGG